MLRLAGRCESPFFPVRLQTRFHQRNGSVFAVKIEMPISIEDCPYRCEWLWIWNAVLINLNRSDAAGPTPE
jgi:hypothetical protein